MDFFKCDFTMDCQTLALLSLVQIYNFLDFLDGKKLKVTKQNNLIGKVIFFMYTFDSMTSHNIYTFINVKPKLLPSHVYRYEKISTGR